MYTIFYIKNNRMEIQRCTTFDVLTRVIKAFQEESIKIVKIQNSYGEKVNVDLT